MCILDKSNNHIEKRPKTRLQYQILANYKWTSIGISIGGLGLYTIFQFYLSNMYKKITVHKIVMHFKSSKTKLKNKMYKSITCKTTILYYVLVLTRVRSDVTVLPVSYWCRELELIASLNKRLHWRSLFHCHISL